MVALQVAIGLVLLLAGGEFLVRGAVAAALRMGMSTMVIGLTLVGFGTSTPELVASLDAALAGSPAIAIGNVVGSNIANILLILGLSALILPIVTDPRSLRRDGFVLAAAAILLLLASLLGVIGRLTGVAFLAALAAYTAYSLVMDRRKGGAAAELHAAEAEEVMPAHPSMAVGLLQALGGIAAVVVGADLLVRGSIAIARDAGLSEAVIGLTLVAVGTSLPELATSVMAAIRGHGNVAFGNIVGSNIFNVLGILGLTAVVSPIAVPRQILAFDIWVMVGVTLLVILFAATGRIIRRWEAGVFLLGYGLYLAAQFSPGLRAAIGL